MDLRTYEGLFLLNPSQASQDWEGIKKQVLEMLERREGQVISAKKWGDRRLAYEIKGHKRGTYLLVYFEMPPDNVSTVRRDIQLSEIVLRNMILVHNAPLDKKTLSQEVSEEDDTDTDDADVDDDSDVEEQEETKEEDEKEEEEQEESDA